MRRLGIALVVTGVVLMMVPLSFGVRANTPLLDVKQIWFVNKSPFLLEGKAEPGSQVSIEGQNLFINVGDDGKFRFELDVVEGVNIFVVNSSKSGADETETVMVEMDSTPPEVTLNIDGKLTNEKIIEIQLQDASKFEISGFTEPGCKVLADYKQCSSDKIYFKAVFRLNCAPSILDHFLEVSDKYGNITKIIIFSNNIHRQVTKMKVGSDKIEIDGKVMTMKTPLQIIGSSAMISIDIIPEAVLVDSTMCVNGDSVTFVVRIDTLQLIFGKRYYFFNGIKKDFHGTVPSQVNGHLLIPLRLICEIFNIELQFDKVKNCFTLIRKMYEF